METVLLSQWALRTTIDVGLSGRYFVTTSFIWRTSSGCCPSNGIGPPPWLTKMAGNFMALERIERWMIAQNAKARRTMNNTARYMIRSQLTKHRHDHDRERECDRTFCLHTLVQSVTLCTCNTVRVNLASNRNRYLVPDTFISFSLLVLPCSLWLRYYAVTLVPRSSLMGGTRLVSTWSFRSLMFLYTGYSSVTYRYSLPKLVRYSW